MKKLLLFFLLILLSPVLVNAAYNDVTLTTDTVLEFNGSLNLHVYTTTASIESMTVNATNFSVIMAPGGSLMYINSPANYSITHNAPSSIVESEICNSSESSLKLKVPGNIATTTVVITPTGTICQNSSSGGGSGGGGGGGGSQAPAQSPSTPVQSPPTVTPAQTTSAVLFAKQLSFGTSDPLIKRLQQILNSDSDTRIATLGPGSPGNETNLFGALTRAAVGKFQLKHKIISNKTDIGFGIVGPKTRAKLNELSSNQTSLTLPAGTEQEQVVFLQSKISQLITQIQSLQAQVANQQH